MVMRTWILCSRILDMVHFETSNMNVDQNVNKFLEVPRRTEKKSYWISLCNYFSAIFNATGLRICERFLKIIWRSERYCQFTYKVVYNGLYSFLSRNRFVVDFPTIRRIVTENRRYFQFSPNKDSGMISSLPNLQAIFQPFSSYPPLGSLLSRL